MNDDQLLRYSRQIMLPEIDAAGQLALADARVLIIGLGGLGSSASIYLAAGGVGELILVDDDVVELSNLQRQIVHGNDDIGRAKVESARETLSQINPDTNIEAINKRLSEEELDEYVSQSTVVCDCSDNFTTRFAINRAAVNNRVPLVSAAAIRFEAQISVFDNRDSESPCYQCLYDESGRLDQTCAANGVVAPLLGIVGSMQAMEAMKVIMNIGTTLTGRLLMLDALRMEWQTAKLNKDPECQVCSAVNHD